MGRKPKVSFEVKLNAVLMYKRGEISQSAIAQQMVTQGGRFCCVAPCVMKRQKYLLVAHTL